MKQNNACCFAYLVKYQIFIIDILGEAISQSGSMRFILYVI